MLTRPGGALARLRAFRASTHALAGLEFALIAPLLVTLFLGTVEISRYLAVLKRVQNAASDIALALSASDETISGATLWRHYNMLPILIPDVISDLRLSGEKDWSQQARMNVTFVVHRDINNKRCGSRCRSKLYVLWSYGRDRRDCGEWTAKSRRVKEGLPTLFRDEGQNFIAVEIRYYYQPLFLRFMRGRIVLDEIFFAPPRYHEEIQIARLGDQDARIANDCRAKVGSWHAHAFALFLFFLGVPAIRRWKHRHTYRSPAGSRHGGCRACCRL